MIFLSTNIATAEEWRVEQIDEKFAKTQPDIKIFSRKRGEYKEYMGEVVLEASIESVYGLVRDTENFEWIKNTKKFDVKELNFFESCVCHEFRSFGFRRKILYVARQEKSLCGSPITIYFGESGKDKCGESIAQEFNNCSEIKNRHKINIFRGFYKLIPLEENKTKFIIYQHIDPKFGDDFFGKMKKMKFPKSISEAFFETLSNFKNELFLPNNYSGSSFKCDEQGFVINHTVN